jgi:hypothetical protein
VLDDENLAARRGFLPQAYAAPPGGPKRRSHRQQFSILVT